MSESSQHLCEVGDLGFQRVGILADMECPASHASPIVDGGDPALRSLKLVIFLFTVEALHLQDQVYPALQANDEVGQKFMRATEKLVVDF